MFHCPECEVVWSKYRRLFKKRSKVAHAVCPDCVRMAAYKREENAKRNDARKAKALVN